MILLGAEVAVGDLGWLRKGVGQPPSRGGDTSLLVLEVREQVPCERLERVGDGAASVEAVVVGQRSGGCFDRVQMVGDRSVLGSESLDDRT